MDSCIRLENVSKAFKFGSASQTVLQNMDLTINNGDFIALVGPSGSGKTTLLNLLSLIDVPDSGSVIFKGSNALEMSDNALSVFRNKHIGIIFQHFNLIPVLSAKENVSMPLQLQGIKKRIADARAVEILTEVGLGELYGKKPSELSGGQRQRVAVARALVTKPDLVVADEPTASLDKDTGLSIIKLLRSMNEKYGTTFVFSTHDPRMIDQIPNQITLVQGKIDEVA